MPEEAVPEQENKAAAVKLKRKNENAMEKKYREGEIPSRYRRILFTRYDGFVSDDQIQDVVLLDVHG
jgi:hypothetical protein